MRVYDKCPSCCGSGVHYTRSRHNGDIEGPGRTCRHCEGLGQAYRDMTPEERITRLEQQASQMYRLQPFEKQLIQILDSVEKALPFSTVMVLDIIASRIPAMLDSLKGETLTRKSKEQ